MLALLLRLRKHDTPTNFLGCDVLDWPQPDRGSRKPTQAFLLRTEGIEAPSLRRRGLGEVSHASHPTSIKTHCLVSGEVHTMISSM
jgi:hypothetical protein